MRPYLPHVLVQLYTSASSLPSGTWPWHTMVQLYRNTLEYMYSTIRYKLQCTLYLELVCHRTCTAEQYTMCVMPWLKIDSKMYIQCSFITLFSTGTRPKLLSSQTVFDSNYVLWMWTIQLFEEALLYNYRVVVEKGMNSYSTHKHIHREWLSRTYCFCSSNYPKPFNRCLVFGYDRLINFVPP